MHMGLMDLHFFLKKTVTSQCPVKDRKCITVFFHLLNVVPKHI